jgi:hypothetical protein
MNPTNLEQYLGQQAAPLTDEQRGIAGFVNPPKGEQAEEVGDKALPTLLSDEEYWHWTEPLTGKRWNIPFLDPASPNYRRDYVNCMIELHLDPDKFKRTILLQ